MNTMKYIKSTISALIVLMLISQALFGQGKEGMQIDVQVINTENEPVSGALIWSEEGSNRTYTDSEGTATVKTYVNDQMIIEAPGYAAYHVTVTGDAGPLKVVLNQKEMLKGPDQLIPIPFGKQEQYRIPGFITHIDVENSLVSDAASSLEELLYGKVPGLFGSRDMRSFGNALIVVDGIPREELIINPSEIEEITVLKDMASSILYGTQGHQGVIMITTKRGMPNKKRINLRYETGVDMIKRLPEYLPAADYMELHNEALRNDGMTDQFGETTIQNTRDGVDPMLYPDEGFYDGRFLNDYRSVNRFYSEFSGGNSKAQYYANLGYTTYGSFFHVGEAAKSRSSVINIRGNTNYELNDWLSLSLDGLAIFDTENSVDHDFWSLSTTLKPNLYPFLIPTDRLQGNELLETASIINGEYILGGTSEYTTNIYGQMKNGGFRKQMDRTLQFSSGLDVDLNRFIDGLTGKVYFSFDMNNSYLSTLVNDYAVYFVRKSNPIGSNSLQIDQIGLDDRASNPSTGEVDFLRRTALYATLDYKKQFDAHKLDLTALAYRQQVNVPNEFNPNRNLHFGLRANYMYDEKYVAEINAAMAGSSKLYGSNKWGFSPGLSLAWILSEEDFLSSASSVDFLKARISAAQASYDTDIGYYQYLSTYETQGTYEYGLFSQYENDIWGIYNLGSPDLDFVRRNEWDLGLEGYFFENLYLEASYFYSKITGDVVQVDNTYPAYFGGTHAYLNFESSKYAGVDLGFRYTKELEDFTFSFGSNLVNYSSEELIVDEPNYENSYRSRVGQPTDALYGLVADGFYRESDFTGGLLNEDLPEPTFTVRAGDIKYIDQNEDGLINERDAIKIGKSHATTQLAVNLQLRYRSFSLFALGVGQWGGQVYFNNDYYWVNGNDKYSEVVLNRWTPENAENATYPRLTTEAGSNNFRNSTFWLYDNDWFELQTVQLTWHLPRRLAQQLRMSRASVYLRGRDLMMFSEIKEQKELNIGTEPKTRGFSLGVNVEF